MAASTSRRPWLKFLWTPTKPGSQVSPGVTRFHPFNKFHMAGPRRHQVEVRSLRRFSLAPGPGWSCRASLTADSGAVGRGTRRLDGSLAPIAPGLGPSSHVLDAGGGADLQVDDRDIAGHTGTVAPLHQCLQCVHSVSSLVLCRGLSGQTVFIVLFQCTETATAGGSQMRDLTTVATS